MSVLLPRNAVAAEVRAEMGRAKISGVKLAERLGWQTKKLNRRLNGAVAFDVDDLSEIAAALDVPITNLLPRLDSNQQPAGSKQRIPAHAAAA